jgi:hypothetical protein
MRDEWLSNLNMVFVFVFFWESFPSSSSSLKWWRKKKKVRHSDGWEHIHDQNKDIDHIKTIQRSIIHKPKIFSIITIIAMVVEFTTETTYLPSFRTAAQSSCVRPLPPCDYVDSSTSSTQSRRRRPTRQVSFSFFVSSCRFLTIHHYYFTYYENTHLLSLLLLSFFGTNLPTCHPICSYFYSSIILWTFQKIFNQ